MNNKSYKTKSIRLAAATAMLALSALIPAGAQPAGIAPSLEEARAPFSSTDYANFQDPPKLYHPETWFHFIGGNVSKEGIDADLEAISAAGLSGIQWFHGHFGGQWPGTTEQIKALTPEWEEMVSYLSKKAESLGLRLSIQTCPGWAMAGGPWIQPEDAMRTLVWSRTDVKPGQKAGILPVGKPSEEEWRDYRDIRVLAFPTPLGDIGAPLQPYDVVSEEEDWAALVANVVTQDDVWAALNAGEGAPLKAKPGTSHKVTFKIPEGSVIRTMELPPINNMTYNYNYNPRIHVRLTAFSEIAEPRVILDLDVPMSNWQDGGAFVLACDEAPEAAWYELSVDNVHDLNMSYVRFYSAARKNSWQGEAGFTLHAKELFQQHTIQDTRAFVKSEDIVDLTSRMGPDGSLDWKAPEGRGDWTIIRFGHVNAGQKNGPAPPEATGFECNKLDPKGADIQFANYVGKLYDGPLAGRAQGMLMDSWECKRQTWTADMEEEFASRAGYDLWKHIPSLMGYVIDSQELTSRFLIDWRRTVSSLYEENFFKRMTDLAHEKGLQVQYETAGGDVVVMDPIAYYRFADVPMCEFWQPVADGFVGDLNFKPIKPTASAAHIYGKTRVAAESFTSFELTWDEHWEMLKEVANLNMSEGVTHNVFHTYTHNPQVGFLPPGTSFGSSIGTPFLRGQTWWKYMPYFTNFLARMNYMMERGRPVADVLWYLGDEVGHRPFQKALFPEGFKYDYCNPDALMTRLSVKDGRIVTEDGTSYGMIWIPENERMLPETVAKLRSLIKGGAKVAANAPVAPATLKDGRKGERKFARQVGKLWNKALPGKVTKIGKGQLAVGMTLGEALDAFGLKPRLLSEGAKVQWLERSADGADWFFVAAPHGSGYKGTVRFLSDGVPEIWDPVDGSSTKVESRQEDGYQLVDLDLARAGNCFVVFRKDGASDASEPVRPGNDKLEVKGWTVSFPEGWGAPDKPIKLSELLPWKDLPLGKEGKAFSGTAVYEATFDLPAGKAGGDIVLDLGDVNMIADVKVNGQDAGVVWATPYQLPIGSLAKEGKNTLTVAVTGTWYNRLAYDASLPEAQRKTWTIGGPAAGSPLHESGLRGPVNIMY